MEDHRLNAAPNSGIDQPDPLQPMFDTLYSLPDGMLMRVRQFIDKTLHIDIGSLDLAEEIGMQYRQGKALLASIENDHSVPVNQKAQLFNTVQAQLAQMVKMREEVYSQERLKRYEGALLKAFEVAPDDNMRHMFFDLYGTFLKDPNASIETLRLEKVKPK